MTEFPTAHSPNQEQKSKRSKTPLLLIAMALCLGAIAGYVYFNQIQTQKENSIKTAESQSSGTETSNPTFDETDFLDYQTRTAVPFDIEPFERGYRLGDVLIKYEDLETVFSIANEKTSDNLSNLNLWQEAAEILNNNAIILNEGIKLGYVEAKELPLRYDPKLVSIAKEKYAENDLQHISGEIISVWFFNVEPPEIGLEAGRAQAESVAKDLRSRMTNGLSALEAAEILKNNESMKKIDYALERNAYTLFENYTSEDVVVHDPQFNDIIWQLELGEVSPVITARDFSGEEWFDAYFAIVKLSEKELDAFPTFEKLYETRKLEGFKIELNQK